MVIADEYFHVTAPSYGGLLNPADYIPRLRWTASPQPGLRRLLPPVGIEIIESFGFATLAGGVWGQESRALSQSHEITFSVNGRTVRESVEARTLLSDFLRHRLGLTGTHVGCEHGVCGACTILLDGAAVRSCLLFAVQAAGSEILTVEGLTPEDSEQLHPIQEAFREAHGLQCGFCTPGILLTVKPFLAENPNPTEDEIRIALSGNLCRCTGYQNIVDAVRLAASKLGASDGETEQRGS